MHSVLTISAIIQLIVISLCEEHETALTTAAIRESIRVSAEPSTIDTLSRIDVHQVLTQSNTSLNLFQLTNPKPRRSADIWNWDYWCQLQPKQGSCTDYSERYYYDAQLDMCLKFTYSGCQGNRNKFNNIVECEQHCVGAVYMTIKETSPSAFCQLQHSGGLCLALIPQYYYDLNENVCKPFTYGGCGGNQNRFSSIGTCQDICQNRERDPEPDGSDADDP